MMLNEISKRRLLQCAVFVLAGVPVFAGVGGMIYGTAMIAGHPVDISLDSHMRYLSGILCALGLGFWSTIPAIETKTVRFRLLTFLVFTGGLGRLAGILLAGRPSHAMLFGLAMELLVTPALCLWQARILHSKDCS